MDHKNINHQDIWGEEWQWPLVGEVADSMLAQQAEECLLEEKTEEEIRMEKFIVENILHTDESQHGNSSGSSSDKFSQFRAPLTGESGLVFSFPPPIHSTGWAVHRTDATAATPYSYPIRSASVNPYSTGRNPYIPPRSFLNPRQDMIMPARHFSLPITSSSPISIPSMSSTHTIYAPISRSQSSPPSPSLFRTFNPSSLPPPSPSGRVRRNSRSSDQCGFCKRNGEIAQIYNGHRLADPQGRVMCPQLRVLVCELCGATGDGAHTRNYCPSNTQARSVALPTLLKSTPRQSDGKWRRRGGR